MKAFRRLILIVAVLALVKSARAQGTFENLDFESADVASYAPDSTDVPVSDALPGWGAFYGNTQMTQVSYDDISFGGAEISVIDSHAFAFAPLQGMYSAFLFGGVANNSTLESVAISQTAVVPAGTQSLGFDAYVFGAPFVVTLGGQTINTSLLEMFPKSGTTPAYALYGGNIPASFAGLTAALTFTEPPATGVQPSELELDNIAFSPIAVTPEPGALALMGMGGLLFALYRGFALKRQ
jgi:hypothetical protein